MPIHNIKEPEKSAGLDAYDEKMRKEILLQLKKREKRRRFLCFLCILAAVLSFGYFIYYYYLADKTGNEVEKLSDLKSKKPASIDIEVNKTGREGTPDILDEYKNLYNKNKSMIGWLKIDDTNIDYPVMQSVDQEYYLTHNFDQEYDKNGSIFMDPACDVLKPSTNFILYGHHMKSGNMFGDLEKYQEESYFKEHQKIRFDTLYEKGTYKVMYVFRSRLYTKDEITFKYYQFIDAASAEEFNSNMKAMKEMELYDTKVKADYGDQILTLSTCDNQEKDGRFVVVAKRIS